MDNKENALDQYAKIAKELSDIKVDPTTSQSHFFCSIAEVNGQVAIQGAGGGSEDSMARMLSFYLTDPQANLATRKAFLLGAANLMCHGDLGNKAEAIGFLLGNFVEENMGGIECDCEACKARKAYNKSNLNVN